MRKKALPLEPLELLLRQDFTTKDIISQQVNFCYARFYNKGHNLRRLRDSATRTSNFFFETQKFLVFLPYIALPHSLSLPLM